MKYKLGKLPATHDSRDLLMEHFVDLKALPPVPAQFGHENLVADWGMLANDRVGDCAVAGPAHAEMLFTAEGGFPAPFNDDCVIADYSAISGYNPSTGSNDNGCNLRDVLKYWKNTGLVDANGVRHKIDGFVALEPGNIQHLRAATYLFQIVDAGWMLPNSADAQFGTGQPFSVVSGARIVGGHCMMVAAYRRFMRLITWGALQDATDNFYREYNDESFAILDFEMLKDGKSIDGFDKAALVSALERIG